MTALEERKTMIAWIGEATLAGARQALACKELGLSARTVQRWQSGEPDAVDGRSLRNTNLLTSFPPRSVPNCWRWQTRLNSVICRQARLFLAWLTSSATSPPNRLSIGC